MGVVMGDRVSRTLEKFADAEGTLDEMAQRMSMGEGLVKICTSWDIPFHKMRSWLYADVKRFAVYQNAMTAMGDLEADEIKEIADASEDPKLRMDARKFRVPKLSPAIWGEPKDRGGSGVTVIVNRDVSSGGGGVEIKARVAGVEQSVTVLGAVSDGVSDGVSDAVSDGCVL